jgi:hypothetical protein
MIGTEKWKLAYQRPFQSFTIRMADGRSFRISHPEAVVPSFQGRTVKVLDSANGTTTILDLFLMTELETELPPVGDASASPNERNGKS